MNLSISKKFILPRLIRMLWRWFYNWFLIKKITKDVLRIRLRRILKLMVSKFMFLNIKRMNLPLFSTTFQK
jgi:hypothetical protein